MRYAIREFPNHMCGRLFSDLIKTGDMDKFAEKLEKEGLRFIQIINDYLPGVALCETIDPPNIESTTEVRRIAPWADFVGNTLYAGDRIIHPDGTTGQVIYVEGYSSDSDSDKWMVDYGKKLSRLCLQIGDKGQAVKLLED